MPATTTRVRHAVSRSTGATTWTRKDGDEWKTTCLNHGSETAVAARAAAWKNGSTPALFCAKCKAIASGKADRVTVGLVELPSKQPAKKAIPPRGTTKKTSAK